MVSYNSILRDLCGDEVYGEFFSEPNSSSHGVREAEQLPVSVANRDKMKTVTWCNTKHREMIASFPGPAQLSIIRTRGEPGNEAREGMCACFGKYYRVYVLLDLL